MTEEPNKPSYEIIGGELLIKLTMEGEYSEHKRFLNKEQAEKVMEVLEK